MRNFNNEIKNIGKEWKLPPVFDGIVNEQKYQNSEIKIMWVLKDPNSTGEYGSYDLREAINTLKCEYGVRKEWGKTFNNIIYVTHGILNNAKWEDIPYPKNEPDIVDVLQNIAYINIKKIGGGAKSKDKEINEHYQKHKRLLLEQINEFNPDVVIFGSTYDYFKEDLKLNQMNIFGSCHATAKDNRIYLAAYHPNARMRQKDYFNDIITAYTAFKKVSENLHSKNSFQKDILKITDDMRLLADNIDTKVKKLINAQKFEKAAELRTLKINISKAINILKD